MELKYKNIELIDTYSVKEGVVCKVYKFIDDDSKDLAIITVQPGAKTPLQHVLNGDQTLEGYVDGKGFLIVTTKDGQRHVHSFPSKENSEVNVEVGQLMQWQADQNEPLVFSELCIPSYEDGRFEDIPE